MRKSESILGKPLKAIGAPRESFVVMTKVFYCSVENGTMTFDDIVAGINPKTLAMSISIACPASTSSTQSRLPSKGST